MLSPAKINLGLKIPFKRTDGYHEIESIFLKLNWGDSIEINFLESKDFQLTTTNLLKGASYLDYEKVSEKGDLEKNILYKTWKQAQTLKTTPGVHIQLTKQIPTGGGLGGGSTNAASLLRFLFPEKLPYPDEEFLRFASLIGADVPFFLKESHQLVGGIGEKLEDISVASGVGTLVFPGYTINTKFAFQNLKKHLQESPPLESWRYLQEEVRLSLLEGDWDSLKDHFENEFEEYAVSLHPDLRLLKDAMYSLGFSYVSMTGSGSCFYGIHSDKSKRDRMQEELQKQFPQFEFYSFSF
jgi:4-diphosphocytidyl-2-C-methyl-D-erythritol kinase